MSSIARRIVVPTLIAALVALGACTSSDSEPDEDSVTDATPEVDLDSTTPDTARSPSPQPGDDGPTELFRIRLEGATARIYVLVEPDLSDDELIAIAETLHAGDPDHKVVLLDDDEMADVIERELPNTTQGDTSEWPDDWVVEHTVGTLEAVLVPDGDDVEYRYVLARGTGGVLPDDDDALAVFDGPRPVFGAG